MDRRTKLIVMTVTIFLVLFILIVAWGFADDGGLDAWVICQPGQFVSVREGPSEAAECIGRRGATDMIRLNGTYQDGFAHCDAGWIPVRCIVTDKPEWMNGSWYILAECTVAWTGYEWEKPTVIGKGTQVQVFWRSAEYCVTTRGMIRTEDLEEEICPICNN